MNHFTPYDERLPPSKTTRFSAQSGSGVAARCCTNVPYGWWPRSLCRQANVGTLAPLFASFPKNRWRSDSGDKARAGELKFLQDSGARVADSRPLGALAHPHAAATEPSTLHDWNARLRRPQYPRNVVPLVALLLSILTLTDPFCPARICFAHPTWLAGSRCKRLISSNQVRSSSVKSRKGAFFARLGAIYHLVWAKLIYRKPLPMAKTIPTDPLVIIASAWHRKITWTWTSTLGNKTIASVAALVTARSTWSQLVILDLPIYTILFLILTIVITPGSFAGCFT